MTSKQNALDQSGTTLVERHHYDFMDLAAIWCVISGLACIIYGTIAPFTAQDAEDAPLDPAYPTSHIDLICAVVLISQGSIKFSLGFLYLCFSFRNKFPIPSYFREVFSLMCCISIGIYAVIFIAVIYLSVYGDGTISGIIKGIYIAFEIFIHIKLLKKGRKAQDSCNV